MKRGLIDSSKPTIYRRRQLKAIAARWDARAASWDQALTDPACHLNDDDAYHRFTREVLRLIRQRREFCSTHGVIDAGCGTGLVLGKVISAFAWGIGMDISPQMVRVARRKPLPGARFVVGDCFELPLLRPKAGAVLSRGVLLSHYGRRQGKALLQAARGALVEGGFVVFDFLNEAARAQQGHAPKTKTWLTGDEVRSMARRAGFSATTILGKPDRRVLLLVAALDAAPRPGRGVHAASLSHCHDASPSQWHQGRLMMKRRERRAPAIPRAVNRNH